MVIGIMLLIALVHASRVGTYLPRNLQSLYYSYFSDVVIPFGFYFLLCLNDTQFRALRDWRIKALLVFGAATITEILQFFGVPLLGRTFDSLDIVMFAAGVLLAVLADRFALSRVVPGWSHDADPRP